MNTILVLIVIIAGGITTLPLSIGLLTVDAVVFRKPWVFSLALGLGLFSDLTTMGILGYSSLLFTLYVFLVFLYERKFETRTVVFVFISTFVGSAIYLTLFAYRIIWSQALINAIIWAFLFKAISKFEFNDKTIEE